MSSGLQIVAVSSVAAQPWRNGGGVTRELLAWPSAADWACRISVADISANGPFSAYAGIERWFSVVAGEGVVLRLADTDIALTTDSEPLCFDGEAAPACRLQRGATRDLNLMTRRSAGASRMQRALIGHSWRSDEPLRALFTANALTLHIDADAALLVPAWSLVVANNAAQQQWSIEVPAPSQPPPPRAWWLAFQPRSSPCQHP